MSLVLVTPRSFRQAGPRPEERLRRAGYELKFNDLGRTMNAAEMAERAKDAVGIIPGMDQITREVFEAAPRLKVISRYGVGYETIDLEAATEFGVVVTNTPGVNSEAVADLAFSLILSLARWIPRHDSLMKRRQWKRTVGTEMPGSTLGIIGLGAIGKGVARRARGFDMRVLAYDVAFDKDFAGLYGVEEVGLEELLGESDFVSLHCPVTPETEGLISGERIKLMKRTAYLINTARAELIDEDALRDALKEGRVAGAGLDVFRTEPPWDSPLVELDNVILTPHTGACTRQTIERMALRSVENALAVLEGKRPKSVVNPEVYDKE